MSTRDKLFCDWSRKRKKKKKAKSGCCREQMGSPEVIKHFRAKEFGC